MNTTQEQTIICIRLPQPVVLLCLLSISMLLIACERAAEPTESPVPIVIYEPAPTDDPADLITNTIVVDMHDIYYGQSNDNQANPPVWHVTADALVTVNADNQGTLEHNWVVIQQGATLPDVIIDIAQVEDSIIFDLGNIAGNSTGSGRFTAPAPGVYTVICTVAGHYPSMQGRLVVER